MSLHLIIILVLLVLVTSLFFIFGFRVEKDKKHLSKGMNLTLLSVSLPMQSQEEKNQKVPIEEYFQNVEQFYSSLIGITDEKEGLFKKRRTPYFVFEIAVHRASEEIYFYVSCPRSLSETIEKQILGFWPKAEIVKTSDYNIFNPEGKSLGAGGFLRKSEVLPLRNYQEFKTDPLSSITSVLTKIKKEGEGASIQIIIKPTKKSLIQKAGKVIKEIQDGKKVSEAVNKSGVDAVRDFNKLLFVKTKEEEQKQNPEKAEMTPSGQKAIEAISEKADKPLFEVNLRLVASAENENRTQAILEQLKSSFDQFGSSNLNQIGFQDLSKKKLGRFFYYFSFRIFDETKKMHLSTKELAGILHFPSPDLLTPNIKWVKSKQTPPPVNLPPKGTLIGKSVFRGEEKEVKMADKDRGRHFYVIGQTGTGKSGLFKNLVRQDIEAGKGVALIDPHGDLAEDVISTIPPERAEDVIYFNPTDIERPLGLNMLDYDERYPESKTFVVNEMIEIFDKLYNLKSQGFGGPMFEQYMRNAILLIMEDISSGSTLIEIPKVLADTEFRKYKLSQCKNIVVKDFWEKEAEKAGGEASLANMVPYITSKTNVFIANDLVRPIISQQKSSFNFREMMDEEKILIVNLSKGKLGDVNSFLLGMVIVGKLLIAAFSRTDIPENERKDFNLYIDEFQNVTTTTISSILSEARKYRLNLTIAHQFIGQLSEDITKSVFGNVGSMMSFRIGPEDAKFLTSEFAPVFNENDLTNFDNFSGALRLLINGETSKPFNIKTVPPKEGNTKTASLIKDLSRIKYGRNRDSVEAELYSRLKKSY